jgi:hypothetical protein
MNRGRAQLSVVLSGLPGDNDFWARNDAQPGRMSQNGP